ncbi:hypothetical protein MU767_23770, partial [Salmonella enterica subsp. enterica serovar Enteritidis]|nr:hypothetical protein [Salmonella enterica subsp. enterica serovar Enteritidis]
CKLNELVSVAGNNRLHRNIEEVENLNEPEEARLMAGFFGFIEVFDLLNVPVESVVSGDRNQFIQFA